MSGAERPEQALEPCVQTGGELNASITSAIVGINQRYLGRGPTSASTFHHENVVVTIMHGVLTLAEQTLVQGSGENTVASMRNAFQGLMEDEFTQAVERLTGRQVLDFVSGTNVDSGVACEVFVLDGRP
jgi:uncharacterized protein YbcI